MSLSTILISLVIFGTMFYKKQYQNIIGLIYLLICIFLSGYIFVGYRIDGYEIVDKELEDTAQFFKFLFGWIIMYTPYLLYVFIYKKKN